MTAALGKRDDGTIELTATVPWTDVSAAYGQVVDEMVRNAEVSGFRKGKAPRKLVEEKLDKSAVYEEVLKKLVPKVYNDAVKAHGIHPLIMPKIELKEATEGKDWVVRMLTCEKPTVTVGDYKKAVTDLKVGKAKQIWVPGKDKDAQEEGAKKPTIDELLLSVYGVVTIKLPSLLVEHEVNRLLSALIDQTRKLGISVEQYLASTNRTGESIRREYEEEASRTLTLEFALETIADTEGIFISDDDVSAVIKTAKTEEEQKALEGQRYYLASVLRRQKTIDFLAAL